MEKFFEKKIMEQVRYQAGWINKKHVSASDERWFLFFLTESVQRREIWRSHSPYILQEIRTKTESGGVECCQPFANGFKWWEKKIIPKQIAVGFFLLTLYYTGRFQ